MIVHSIPTIISLTTITKLQNHQVSGNQESQQNEEEYNPTGSPAIITKTQILASVAVSLGSMIVGYSSAWSSPAIADLMEAGSHIEV